MSEPAEEWDNFLMLSSEGESVSSTLGVTCEDGMGGRLNILGSNARTLGAPLLPR